MVPTETGPELQGELRKGKDLQQNECGVEIGSKLSRCKGERACGFMLRSWRAGFSPPGSRRPSVLFWKFPLCCVRWNISSEVPQVQRRGLGWGLEHLDVTPQQISARAEVAVTGQTLGKWAVPFEAFRGHCCLPHMGKRRRNTRSFTQPGFPLRA